MDPASSTAMEKPTLREASAEDLVDYGPVQGHCVLCQEPVHEKDLWAEVGKRPLCCEREVPEEWRAAFRNETRVYICCKAPKKCTDEFLRKRENGLLVTSHGIEQEFLSTLGSQPLAMKVLQGKLQLKSATADDKDEKGEDSLPRPLAADVAMDAGVGGDAPPPMAEQAAEQEPKPLDREKELKPIILDGLQPVNREQADSQATSPERVDVEGTSQALPVFPQPRLEDVAEEAVKAAVEAVAPAAPDAPPASWNPSSVKEYTTGEMAAIIAKDGIYKDDVLEKCSSGSWAYGQTWVRNQGKAYPPWAPSLSSSVAVLAAREVPRADDRHSATARPRVLLCSKITFPVESLRSKSRTRSTDGKFAGDPDQEQLASELLAYPFEEKTPTTVYVELVRPDSGQKQRVPFAFCLMVDMFAHADSREAFLAETEQQAGLDGVDDGEIAIRKLLANEPLAILYCVDGSYVKASTSILKTSSGADSGAATAQMCSMVQKAYKDHLAGNRDDDVKVKHFGAAEDLGLIQTDSENSQCTFNWKALADLPWADANCWQKLVDQHAVSMNPSASGDNDTSAKLEVGELINLLTDLDEETKKLKEEERERQEKNAKRAQQTAAKSAAETLTNQLLKHAGNIRAAIPVYHKNGKPGAVSAKLRNTGSASLQAFERLKIELDVAKAALTANGYDPDSVAEAQQSSRPGKRKAAITWNSLLAAFEDLQAAITEHNDPQPVEIVDKKKPASAGSKGPDPKGLVLASSVKAEMAAKDRAIQSKTDALESKEREIKAMRDELSEALKNQKDSMVSIIEGAKAQGRADAQQEELDKLRNQNLTFTNDIRLNSIRQGADGKAAQSMSLLQFASTLQATANATMAGGGDAAQPKPFDSMDLLRAMQGGGGSSSTAPQIGYGGADSERQWAEEQKLMEKEKKRKRKAKKEKRKARKEAKLAELINEKKMSYEDAKHLVEDVYESSSSDESSKSF